MLKKLATPPDMVMHWQRIYEGEYDVSVTFDGAPVVVDIGGCIGVFSQWARIRWPGCKLHIYEPNPRAHRLLEKNCAHLVDGYDITKAAVLAYGTGDRPETVRLYQGAHNLGEASTFASAEVDATKHVDVPVTWAKDLPACDVLKADCEGAEREILAEYLATHEALPAVVAVEYHTREDAIAMMAMLVAYGYRTVKAIEYDYHHGVLAWRHEPESGQEAA